MGKFIPLVRDVMTHPVMCAAPRWTVRQAKEVMRDNDVSGIPVVDAENLLLGIISVADIIRAMEENGLDETVQAYMTTGVVSVRQDVTAGQALRIFRQHKYGRFPVLDEQNRVVGMISPNDVIGRLAQILDIDTEERSETTSGGPDKAKEAVQFSPQCFSYSIQGEDFDRSGEGAGALKKLLKGLGISGDIIRRSAIAAYEAEINVIIHAYGGKMMAEINHDAITITVEDTGPGIADLNQAMKKGFSTADEKIRRLGFGAGMGLSNIKKSADEFYIESSPQGTKLIIRIHLRNKTKSAIK